MEATLLYHHLLLFRKSTAEARKAGTVGTLAFCDFRLKNIALLGRPIKKKYISKSKIWNEDASSSCLGCN
jgi:hypothetical protein